MLFCWLWLFANGAGAGIRRRRKSHGRSVVDQDEGRETGEGEVSKLCERTTRTLPEKALFARGMAALWRARARSVFA